MEKPSLTLKEELQFLGPSEEHLLHGHDQKSGIRDVQVT